MKNLLIVSSIVIIIFYIAVIVFYPFIIIFALNTVFISLSIPYTFWTWLSIVILQLSTVGGLANILRNIEKKL